VDGHLIFLVIRLGIELNVKEEVLGLQPQLVQVDTQGRMTNHYHCQQQKGWMYMSIKSELRAFKEITSWDEVGHHVPNHIYILNPHGHLVGYKKSGGGEYVEFSKPMKQFEKSRRKFVELIPVEKYMEVQKYV
jgi:hypothetical protein